MRKRDADSLIATGRVRRAGLGRCSWQPSPPLTRPPSPAFGLERLQWYRDRVEVLREDADLALPATQPPGPQRVKSGGSFHHANDPFRSGLVLPRESLWQSRLRYSGRFRRPLRPTCTHSTRRPHALPPRPGQATRQRPSSSPGIVEHWNVEDLRPDIPGIQFLIQISNPGAADGVAGRDRRARHLPRQPGRVSGHDTLRIVPTR
jgi:hypothetical protein